MHEILTKINKIIYERFFHPKYFSSFIYEKRLVEFFFSDLVNPGKRRRTSGVTAPTPRVMNMIRCVKNCIIGIKRITAGMLNYNQRENRNWTRRVQSIFNNSLRKRKSQSHDHISAKCTSRNNCFCLLSIMYIEESEFWPPKCLQTPINFLQPPTPPPPHPRQVVTDLLHQTLIMVQSTGKSYQLNWGNRVCSSTVISAPIKMYAARPVADRKQEQFSVPHFLNQSFSETVLADIF